MTKIIEYFEPVNITSKALKNDRSKLTSFGKRWMQSFCYNEETIVLSCSKYFKNKMQNLILKKKRLMTVVN